MKEPYLIFEKEVALWADIFPATAITVRTRPHTPTPAKMGEISKICKLCNYETDCKEHDTDIARAATLKENKRVLDAMLKAMDEDKYYLNIRWKYREIIESLRQQAGEL
jgi:hypothetical protein